MIYEKIMKKVSNHILTNSISDSGCVECNEGSVEMGLVPFRAVEEGWRTSQENWSFRGGKDRSARNKPSKMCCS